MLHSDKPIYIPIYNELKEKIKGGAYGPGERFPSCSRLCQEYGVSDRTMRLAVRMLADDGYIRTKKRHPTVVLYDREQIDGRKILANMKADEIAMFKDSFRTYSILMPSILWYCAPLCGQEDCNRLDIITEEMYGAMDDEYKFWSLSADYWRTICNKADNQFVKNIVKRIKFFEGKPTPSLPETRQKYVTTLKNNISHLREHTYSPEYIEEYDLAYHFEADLRNAGNTVLTEQTEVMQPDMEDSAGAMRFVLEQYKRVYLDLIRRALTGEFEKGDYLPSRASLCSQYGISYITASRAVKELENFGIAEPVMGKGIRLVVEPEKFDQCRLNWNVIFKHTRQFADCLEVIVLTIPAVAGHVAEHAGAEEARTLYGVIRSGRPNTVYYTSSVRCLLNFIVSHIRYFTLRNIYSEIERTYLSGFEQILLFPEQDTEYVHFAWETCCKAAEALLEGDKELFECRTRGVFSYVYDRFVEECKARGYWEHIFC